MRLISCLGIGKDKHDQRAYKTAEMEAQKEEAIVFREEIQREAEALVRRLRANTRLRGGGNDAHPRSSH